MDFLGMRLCGLKRAVTHTSVAAGFGLFDVREGSFMKDKLSAIGIDETFLPRVTALSQSIGEWNGIPITVAIGDNQASFMGSMGKNDTSILVNIGTGSQISATSGYCQPKEGVEIRPFINGKYLICGSALCGGAAYAMLERFFRSYAVSAGMQDESQYEIMNALASEAYGKKERGLRVDTSFGGKRTDPDHRGSIERIDEQNFTPAALVLGVLKGMCEELYQLYEAFPQNKTHVIASGGAVRKNMVLQKLIADRFGMPVSVNKVIEEAATGAALFSACVIGKIAYDGGCSEYANTL
jgi:sedoheptulokinase